MSSFTGESGSARRARRRAEIDIAAQRKKEESRLASSEDELARSKAARAGGHAGRQSLIKTSPSGLAINLGGTNV